MASNIRLRRWFWLDVAVAVIFWALALATLIRRDWIEFVFGIDPDEGSGALEWLIVATFGVIAVVSAVAARIEWRRAQVAAGGG
jgi:hypothetical protein